MLYYDDNNVKLLLFGDFNFPKLRRSIVNGLVTDFFPLGLIESEFILFLSYLNLRQFNFVTNQNHVILYYVISNIDNTAVSRVENPVHS